MLVSPADVAVTGALAVVLLVAFHHELGFPIRVGVLFVPGIVAVGFATTIAVQYYTSLSALQAAAVLAGALATLVVVFELLPGYLRRPNYAFRRDRR